MWLQQDFLANHFQKPARTEERTTTETCGPNSSESFAQFDRKTSCWRTSQICLLTNTSEPFSDNWPRSGMTVDGIAYRRPTVARRINATAFGSLLNDGQMLCKTPSEYDGRTKHPKKDEYRLGHSGTLAQEVTSGFLESVRKWPADTLWPTPRASEWKGTGPLGSKSQAYRLDRKYLDATVQEAEQRTGKLNPQWVDWLMGVPTGFTACAVLEMGKFQSWWQQHGGS